MTILETLTRWSDVELAFTNKEKTLEDDRLRHIICYYFFGSCDLCAQAMELDDTNFKNLYKDVLNHIGITNIEINSVFETWMLDKFSDSELFMIQHGARCFSEFENNPNGVGGLRFCFSKFSKNSNKHESEE